MRIIKNINPASASRVLEPVFELVLKMHVDPACRRKSNQTNRQCNHE